MVESHVIPRLYAGLLHFEGHGRLTSREDRTIKILRKVIIESLCFILEGYSNLLYSIPIPLYGVEMAATHAVSAPL